MEALITKAEIQAIRQISENYKDSQLNTFILEVQRTNLKELLGRALHKDFFDNLTDAKYQNLLNGTTYLESGQSVNFEGLKPYLIYLTIAKIIAEAEVQYSETGVTSYAADYETRISTSQITTLANNFRAIANDYANETIEYLNELSSQYPLWETESEEESNLFFNIT